jgi:hypothetical protein
VSVDEPVHSTHAMPWIAATFCYLTEDYFPKIIFLKSADDYGKIRKFVGSPY